MGTIADAANAKESKRTGPFKAKPSPLGWTVVLEGPQHVWWQNKDREEAESCAHALNAAWALGYDAAKGKVPPVRKLTVVSTPMKSGTLPGSEERCTVCGRDGPLLDGECPDCRH